MTKIEAGTLVAHIVEDLSSRRGLDREWDSIHDTIKNEIRNKWIGILLTAEKVSDRVVDSLAERAVVAEASVRILDAENSVLKEKLDQATRELDHAGNCDRVEQVVRMRLAAADDEQFEKWLKRTWYHHPDAIQTLRKAFDAHSDEGLRLAIDQRASYARLAVK